MVDIVKLGNSIDVNGFLHSGDVTLKIQSGILCIDSAVTVSWWLVNSIFFLTDTYFVNVRVQYVLSPSCRHKNPLEVVLQYVSLPMSGGRKQEGWEDETDSNSYRLFLLETQVGTIALSNYLLECCSRSPGLRQPYLEYPLFSKASLAVVEKCQVDCHLGMQMRKSL